MTRYAKLTSWLIGAWFVVALALSALHVLRTAPNQPPLALGLAALIPVAVFLIWFARSAGFREFTLSLNPTVLTAIQTWRVEGMTFLILATYGILPKMFAMPAGWGDITIGVTAPLAALLLAQGRHKTGFLAWQLLGILDLVVAVTMGTMAGVLDPHGIPTTPMQALPLSLIPTFAVPLLLMLHIICVAQARRWPARATQPTAATVIASAA
jgi:hypothetical protein